MSFGFSFGDFVAALKVAKALYKDIYLVGCAAPKELQLLRDDVGLLSQSILLLIDEVNNPKSTLICGGPIRVEMVNSLMSRILETLHELQSIKTKHFRLDEMNRSKIKRIWDKTRWALDVPPIESLRAKVQVNNGFLSLLLTSVGNSSLQRIEMVNRQMAQDIGGVKEILTESATIGCVEPPVLSLINGDNEKGFQISLSHAFMIEAERIRPWMAVGFDKWIHAGRWWLMKSQSEFFTQATQGSTIPTQAYADLLKASWILVDVIAKHPQQRFWSPTREYLQVQMLTQMIKDQLTTIQYLAMRKPRLSEVQKADLAIWVSMESVIDMNMGHWAQSGGVDASPSRVIEAPGHFWQGIGSTWASNKTDVECFLHLILPRGKQQCPHLVAQSQTGTDIYSCPIKNVESKMSQASLPFRQQIIITSTDQDQIIYLPSKLAQDMFLIVARALLWCQKYLLLDASNYQVIRGIILILAARSQDKRIIEKFFQDFQDDFPRGIDSTSQSIASLQDFAELSNYIAFSVLEGLSRGETSLPAVLQSFHSSPNALSDVHYVPSDLASYSSCAGKSRFGQLKINGSSEEAESCTVCLYVDNQKQLESADVDGTKPNGDHKDTPTHSGCNPENGKTNDNHRARCNVSCPNPVSKTVAGIISASAKEWVEYLPYLLYETFAVSMKLGEHQWCKLLPADLLFVTLQGACHYGDSVMIAGLILQLSSTPSERARTFLADSIVGAVQSGCTNSVGLVLDFCSQLPPQIHRDIVNEVNWNIKDRRCFRPLRASKNSSYVSQRVQTQLGYLLPKAAGANMMYQHTNSECKENILPVKRLLDLGADPNVILDDGKDYEWEPIQGIHKYEGRSHHLTPALGCAVYHRHIDTAALLLRRGADPNQKSRIGTPPLHVAIYLADIAMAKLLLNSGASVTATDSSNATALHLASSCYSSEPCIAAKMLIQHGACVNARDKEGFEPLHYAASRTRGHSTALALLKAGASVHSRTNSGLTPLDVTLGIALKSRRRWGRDLICLFLRYGANPVPHMPCPNKEIQAKLESAVVVQAGNPTYPLSEEAWSRQAPLYSLLSTSKSDP